MGGITCSGDCKDIQKVVSKMNGVTACKQIGKPASTSVFEVSFDPAVVFEVTENLNVRGSIGTGWRTANIFSENIGLLASSRDIIFAEQLQPEKAINLGFNATQKFKGTNVEGYVSLDYHRTNFQNQIFPDYDTDPTKAIFLSLQVFYFQIYFNTLYVNCVE